MNVVERLSSVHANYPDLAGKVAFITGGTGGIGAEVCRCLAAAGVKVAVNGRDALKACALVDAIRERGGQAIAAPADCNDRHALGGARDAAMAAFGPVELLVAFAGGGSGRPQPIEQTNDQDWNAIVADNLHSTFVTLATFIPGMKALGGGAIVTMSSLAGRVPTPASAAYAAAKAGVIMLTQQAATDLAGSRIRVNCIAPGMILTDMVRQKLPFEQQLQLAAGNPLGRLGQPQDIALAALFLLSNSASWITGATLEITGGEQMGRI